LCYSPFQPQGAPPNMGGMMGAQAGMAQGLRSGGGGGGGYDSDVEGANSAHQNAQAMGNSFGDKAIRRAFIRKVYAILSIQLAVTAAFIALFIYHEGIKLYVRRNQWVMWTAFGIMMVCMIAMSCFESVRRKAPMNYIFLSVFTLCEGVMMGTFSAGFDVDAVLMAIGICAAVTFALTIFAFQTKYDFTTCGGMLCGMVVVLMFAGILMAIMPYNKFAYIGYASAGALIFSMYIVYDTQVMMGGKHKYSISPEEYVFASLSLYLDVINLFMYILMIIGAARSD
jgi:FtsH-binding integral membrane protein